MSAKKRQVLQCQQSERFKTKTSHCAASNRKHRIVQYPIKNIALCSIQPKTSHCTASNKKHHVAQHPIKNTTLCSIQSVFLVSFLRRVNWISDDGELIKCRHGKNRSSQQSSRKNRRIVYILRFFWVGKVSNIECRSIVRICASLQLRKYQWNMVNWDLKSESVR